jgi:hypothetical protein
MVTNPYLVQQTFSEELYRIKPSSTMLVITKPWQGLGYAEKEQLQKISDALKQRINQRLTIDAFQVVHQNQLDIAALNEPKQVIYFGPPIKGLSYYELIEANGVKMVLSEPLQELISNDQGKQKLWKALQQLFAV